MPSIYGAKTYNNTGFLLTAYNYATVKIQNHIIKI